MEDSEQQTALNEPEADVVKASSRPSQGSDNTSATATLNGDDQDEIDYSDNEEPSGSQNGAAGQPNDGDSSNHLQVPADDEITWESENEETPTENATSKEAGQVSPTTGKRARSQSGNLEGASEENGTQSYLILQPLNFLLAFTNSRCRCQASTILILGGHALL